MGSTKRSYQLTKMYTDFYINFILRNFTQHVDLTYRSFRTEISIISLTRCVKFPSVTRNGSSRWRVNLPRWCWKYKRDKNENSLGLTLKILYGCALEESAVSYQKQRIFHPYLTQQTKHSLFLRNDAYRSRAFALKFLLNKKYISEATNFHSAEPPYWQLTGKVHAYHRDSTAVWRNSACHIWTKNDKIKKKWEREKRKWGQIKVVVS